MKKLLAFLPALFILAALLPAHPLPAHAAPLGAGETMSAQYDNAILSLSPDTNYGGSVDIYVGETNLAESASFNTLIYFDLSELPENAIVTDASLTLTQTAEYSSYDTEILVYRLKRNWTESGATWNKYDGSNNWQIAGAVGSEDIDYLAIGERDFDADEANGQKTFSLSPDEITGMINGTYDNYGFMLATTSTIDTAYAFSSSENATEENRPYLEIEYEVPTLTPTLTVTVTPTVTATPTTAASWNYPTELVDASGYIIPDPVDLTYLYDNDSSRLVLEENYGHGSQMYVIFENAPHNGTERYNLIFSGYTDSDDAVDIFCWGENSHLLYTLAAPGSSDEDFTIEIHPDCINDQHEIAILIQYNDMPEQGQYLYLDQMVLEEIQDATPTPAATPQPEEVTATVTYGDVANFSALMLIAAVLGLSLIYNIVSSIVFRKRD